MKVKILRDGAYSDMSFASRGRNVFHLKAGDEVELQDAYAKSLAEVGLVEPLEHEPEPEADPEAKASKAEEALEPEADVAEDKPEEEAAPKPKITRSKKAEPKKQGE
jgi:hypothetical protein